MTFEEWMAREGWTVDAAGNAFAVDGDGNTNYISPDALEIHTANWRAANPVAEVRDPSFWGQAGERRDDIVIGGVPYQQLAAWFPNDPDPQKALQDEIALLKSHGVEPVYDERYGWIAPDVGVDSRVAAAHPEMAKSSIFEFAPFLLGGGLAALAAGAGVAGAGALASEAAPAAGALSDAAIADIVAAEGGFSALPAATSEAMSPLLQAAAKQAAGGAIQSAVTGQDPLEGAVTGGVLGGLSSGIGSLASGLTPYPILDQMAGSAAMGGIVSGAMGGDPLQGALSGATSAGIGNMAGNLASGVTDIPVIDRALGQAGASAVLSGIQGSDPLQAALGSAVGSGLRAGSDLVWNQARGVWEDITTAGQEQVASDEWNIPPGTGMLAAADTGTQTDAGEPGISFYQRPDGSIAAVSGDPKQTFASLEEAQAAFPNYTNWEVMPNGALHAFDPSGRDLGVGWLAADAVEGAQSAIASSQREEVAAAELAQQEQERQYAAEQSRIAQEQAAAEAARIAGEQAAAQAQAEAQAQAAEAQRQAAEGARIAQEQEAVRQAEAQRVAQEAAQGQPGGSADIVATAPSPAQNQPSGVGPTSPGVLEGILAGLPGGGTPEAVAPQGVVGGNGTAPGVVPGEANGLPGSIGSPTGILEGLPGGSPSGLPGGVPEGTSLLPGAGGGSGALPGAPGGLSDGLGVQPAGDGTPDGQPEGAGTGSGTPQAPAIAPVNPLANLAKALGIRSLLTPPPKPSTVNAFASAQANPTFNMKFAPSYQGEANMAWYDSLLQNLFSDSSASAPVSEFDPFAFGDANEIANMGTPNMEDVLNYVDPWANGDAETVANQGILNPDGSINWNAVTMAQQVGATNAGASTPVTAGATANPTFNMNFAPKYGDPNSTTNSLLSALPGLIGAYASNQQAGALKDLAEKQMAMGAPSRARYESSYAPGFTMGNDPGFTDLLNETSRANLHALSTKGNPAGNPTAQLANMDDLFKRNAYPALQNYRTTNASAGGLSAFTPAALGNQQSAIGAQGNVYNALGAAAGDVFNPKSTLEQLLAQLSKTGVTGMTIPKI